MKAYSLILLGLILFSWGIVSTHDCSNATQFDRTASVTTETGSTQDENRGGAKILIGGIVLMAIGMLPIGGPSLLRRRT